MGTSSLTSNFTPSMMPKELLEKLFVKRHPLLERVITQVSESFSGGSQHNSLFIGPRGIGKTHLISLVYHRAKALPEAQSGACFAWLQEEEWGVASFLDLLAQILRALARDSGDPTLEASLEQLYSAPLERAMETAQHLLTAYLNTRPLLLLVENLGLLFDGLEEEGQQRLRSFIQDYGRISIVATTPSLFGAVQSRKAPFYGFFRQIPLETLDVDEAVQMLQHLAEQRGDSRLAEQLDTQHGRARVRAVGHLAGGNPRIYAVLSQFLTHENLNRIQEAFMRMLDDLTPYYQSRMKELSPQQRKLVELFCRERKACMVKELAKKALITPQTVAGQLRKLEEAGYVRKTPVGRESYYELREPLMRLCLEVKLNRGEPIPLFLDFLQLWYSRHELQEQLERFGTRASTGIDLRRYIERVLERQPESAPDPRVGPCLEAFERAYEQEEWDEAVKIAEELNAILSQQDWVDRWKPHLAQLPELGPGLRHWDAVLRYKAAPDIRILLELPYEERQLVQAHLNLTAEEAGVE